MFYVLNIKKVSKIFKSVIIIAIIFMIFIFSFRILFPLKYVDLIYKYSSIYNIEPSLVCAVINTESKFNENAVSDKGASGLMQIRKITADWAAEEIDLQNYSYDNIFQPDININLGCWYLKRLSNQFNGDLKLILAAYNAGSGNVSKWLYDSRYSQNGRNLDNIPFKETHNYVNKVKRMKLVYEILLKFVGGKYE